MAELLKEHREILSELLASLPELHTQPFSARVLLSIYTGILTDGIGILSSLIDYLSHDP